ADAARIGRCGDDGAVGAEAGARRDPHARHRHARTARGAQPLGALLRNPSGSARTLPAPNAGVDMPSDSGSVISVEIHGQRYPIRSALDAEYVARLASYVDEKMRAAAETTPTGDSLRLAVLTALNVA